MKSSKSIRSKCKILNAHNILTFIVAIAFLLCLSVIGVVFSLGNVINPNSIKDQKPELLAKKEALSKQVSLMYHELNELAMDINADYNNYIEKHFMYNQFQKCYMTMQKSNASGVFFKLNQQDGDGFYIHNNASSFISDSKEDVTLLIGPSDLAKANDISLDTEWITDFWEDESRSVFYKQPINNGEKKPDAPLSSLFYFSLFNKINDIKVVMVAIPLISDSGMVYGVCGLELSYEFLTEHLPNDENSRYYFLLTKADDNREFHYKSSMFLDKKDGSLIESNIITKGKQKKDVYTYEISDKTIYAIQQEIQLYPKNNISDNKNWGVMAYAYKQSKNYLFLFLSILSFVIIGAVFVILCINKIKFHKSNIEFGLNINHKENDNSTKDKEEILLFKTRLNSLTKTEKAILEMHIDGLTTEEILEARKITPNTLKSHNNKIYSKMDVKNKAQLISYYFNMMS